jgi:hypothetical protein
MAEGLILKSASFEAGGDEAREDHLETVMENAGFEPVEPEVPEGDSATPPRKGSRRERAIERATAPLREKIKQLEAGRPQGAAQAEPVAARPKPQRADFSNDEAFEDALVKWGNEKFAADKAVENAQTSQQRHLEQNVQNYAAQVKEAKHKYSDWDEVVNQEIFIGQAVQLTILEQENGAEVIYYLATHPAYAAKLGEKCKAGQELSAVREVERLSLRLNPGDEYRRPKPRVPAPVRTVSTGGSSATPSFADIAARPNYPGKARDLRRAAAER